jgi:hypothetical protein
MVSVYGLSPESLWAPVLIGTLAIGFKARRISRSGPVLRFQVARNFGETTINIVDIHCTCQL